MPLRRSCASSLFVLVLCAAAVSAQTPASSAKGDGDNKRSPLRLLPEQTDLVVEVPQPRRLAETLTTLDLLKQVQPLAPVREFFDSTNARRFTQLVAYFEKELGAPWPQLLDRLAGSGAALGVKFGGDPSPVLLVVQGEDEKLTRQFFQLGQKILEQELARQESKEKLVKGSHEGFETARVGDGFHAAIAGSALLVSNSEKRLRAGLALYKSQAKKSMADVPGVREARKMLSPQPLVSFWVNLDAARQSPEAKAAYKSPPRDDPQQTVLLGHYLDLLGRTPFVCAGLYPRKDGFVFTIRMNRGREGMGGDKLLHVPPADMPGSRPLLEPKNVLYSESSYFNIANVWNERTKLFNEKQVQALEKFDKQATPFLLGSKLNRLLTQAGPYYRFVAVHQPQKRYKTTPKISIPAFALVWELREPEKFGKAIEPILRAAALLTGAQVNLKLVEEKYKGCNLVGYRFPEDKPLKGDINDLRFNFTPCFARVGDQFVASSTIELCHELVDLIQKEGTSPTRGDASSGHKQLYASGVAAYLRTIEDLLVTQTALDQAVTPKEAREQVKTLFQILRQLGVLSLEPRFEAKSFQYEIRLRQEKQPSARR